MISQHTLANGFRIIVDKMSDVQSCTVAIGVGTGSTNETKKQNGISHFLEHMAFKGTQKRTAFDIAHEVDCFGGSMNAFTSYDKTVYHIKCQATHLEKTVDILADILLNSSFDKEELERERGVILQELAAGLDTPDDIVFDFYKHQAYDDTPFGRTILGTEENIKSFDRGDFVKYIDGQYAPSNLVLSVAGNVNHQKVFDLAEKYFSHLKNHNNKQLVQSPSYIGGSYTKNKSDLSQVQFVLGFESVSHASPEYYTASVSSAILGRGMSSRLFQEVREKLGLCYTIACFQESHAYAGLFTIYSGTSPKDVKILEETILKELNNATKDITKNELHKVLEQYKSSIIFSNESTGARAQKAIANLLAFDRYITPEEIISNVESITIDDVQKFISNTIKGTPTKVIYGNI
ncbi:MAG: putative Zn-dependent peptidase [Candidatus Deianiraeaceae bacterium]|jgi:predicted Zn-dependent peptidase